MSAEKLRSSALFFFYGGLGRKVLVERTLFSGFLVAAALHGVGHAATALAAGLLGTALAGGSWPISRFFEWVADPVTLTFVGLGGTVVKGLGGTVGATLQSRLAQNVAGSVRQSVASGLLHGGSPLPSGHVAARLSVALREVERGVEDGLLLGTRACLSLLPLGIGLAFVSSKLVWWAVLLLLPFAAILSVARRAWKRSYVRALAVAEALHRELDELVVHMDVWRTYGAVDHVSRALDGLSREAAFASSRAEGARAALSGANEIAAAAILVLCAMAARFGWGPQLDGTFVAFAVPFFMAYRPLRDLGDARSAFDRGSLALASLEALARRSSSDRRAIGIGNSGLESSSALGAMSSRASARPSESPRASSAHPASRDAQLVLPFGSSLGATSSAESRSGAFAPTGARAADRIWRREMLRVEDVGVRRAPESRAISFDVAPGAIVAVVGPTGAGKTTLLRALLGLETSVVGTIRYGDADLVRAGVGPRERPFAWVPQDAPVIGGTLETNVRLGRQGSRSVTDVLRSLGAEQLAQACAGAELGASGRPVSGGERKWIGLARAIVSDLPVLLLDEPTVGLDARAQWLVLAELEKLRATRSIVLVTHQREVAQIADRIIDLGA